MGIFSKSKAICYEKMNHLKRVTITEEKVSFNVNYSSIDVDIKNIPGLLADLIQIYGDVKPMLDKKSQELEAAKSEEEKAKSNDGPIDLSDIPF